MKTQEEIEQLADKYSALGQGAGLTYREGKLENIAYRRGYEQCQEDNAEKKYTEEDMLNASKYGYEFRDTTSFPEHKFEDSCIRNTKQWIYSLNKQD